MSRSAALPAEGHHDPLGARIGMWLFVFTELILFAGLFLTYAVYRVKYPDDFHFAAGEMSVPIGTVNTLLLLTSSLTMVLSIAALERRRRREASGFLMITMLLGAVFLVNKYFEWSRHIHNGLYPGSPAMAQHTLGETVFYGLYYTMTGLHALHVLAGIGVLAGMLVIVARLPRRRVKLPARGGAHVSVEDAGGRMLMSEEADGELREVDVTLVYAEEEEVTQGRKVKLENAGLYWHLVDVIWIFLFPLFYLIS